MKRSAAAIFTLLLVVLVASTSFAQTSVRPMKQIGKQVITPDGTSTALSVPAGTHHLTFSVVTADAYMNADGGAATTDDEPYPAGTKWGLWNNTLDFSKLRFICTGCTVRATFWAAR